MKRTFQPSNIKRKRVHGFRKRSATVGGRRILANRRRKGRKVLSAWKMGDYSYTKLERLTKRPEFQKVLAEGEKKRIGRLCTVFSLPNGLNRKRLGIIASKKVGNAVARNRVKRSIRETFRQMRHRMTPAVDIVVISGKEMVAESYKVIDEKLSNALLAIKWSPDFKFSQSEIGSQCWIRFFLNLSVDISGGYRLFICRPVVFIPVVQSMRRRLCNGTLW